jgi:hypothetical protein
MCLGSFDLFFCRKCPMDFDLRALPTPHPGTATSTASNMPSSNTQAERFAQRAQNRKSSLVLLQKGKRAKVHSANLRMPRASHNAQWHLPGRLKYD